VTGSSEYDNIHLLSGLIYNGMLDQMNDCQFLTKESPPWN
jgi:hypothetical protein